MQQKDFRLICTTLARHRLRMLRKYEGAPARQMLIDAYHSKLVERLAKQLGHTNPLFNQEIFVACSHRENIVNADFRFQNEGSVTILHADSERAKQWIEEHLPAQRTTWGPNGTVIEPRYANDILDGIADDGLDVEFSN